MKKIAALLAVLWIIQVGFAQSLPEGPSAEENWIPAPEPVEFLSSPDGTMTTLYDHAYGVAVTYPSDAGAVAEASAGYVNLSLPSGSSFQYLVSRSGGQTVQEIAAASGSEQIEWLGNSAAKWSGAGKGYWETVFCLAKEDDLVWIFLRCPPEQAAEQERLAQSLTLRQVEADRPVERVSLQNISQVQPDSIDGIYVSREESGILLLKQMDSSMALVELDTYNESGELVHIMPVVMKWEDNQGTGNVSFQDSEGGHAATLTFQLRGKVMTVEQEGGLFYDFSGKYDYAVPFVAFDDASTEYYIQQLPSQMTSLDDPHLSYDFEVEGKTNDAYYYIINAYLSGTNDLLAQFYAAYDLSVIFRTDEEQPILLESDSRICDSIYLYPEDLNGNLVLLNASAGAVRFQPVLPLYFDGFDLRYVCVSSDPEVAVVNDDGIMIPRSAGTAEIELYVEYQGVVYEAHAFTFEVTTQEDS